MNLKNIISRSFNYVILTSKKYNIDESHSLKHSMEVFHHANKIYTSELPKNLFLFQQRDIIYVSSIIHDMCDKKYMNEEKGLDEMNEFLKEMPLDKLTIVNKIVSTMSYSKVRSSGFPNLLEYQLAYNIVREADLLSAYDVDRCIIYQMMHEKCSYHDSLEKAIKLFECRVLKYIQDDLFTTNYSKQHASILHIKALQDIQYLKQIYNIKE